MKISIIIPTLNEEAEIASLIRHLWKNERGAVLEIVVSDGGSSDGTEAEVRAAGGHFSKSPAKGRAAQMNWGAQQAQAEVLYFLHADGYPPKGFDFDILRAVEQGHSFGNFRQFIQSRQPLVKLNSWASKLNGLTASGGDQSLFIRKDLFDELGGYREELDLMEDYDLYRRARKYAKPLKVPRDLQVVDRKYEYNSYLRVNMANAVIFLLYRLGVHPNKLKPLYKKWIKGPRYQKLEP